MIQSETLELVKVLSNPDASGAILILETDIQNIQVEKNSKTLSVENIFGKVYKVSVDGQKEPYDLTEKIKLECTPYQEQYDYINSNYFIYTEETGIKNSFVFQIGDFYISTSSTQINSPSVDPLGYALQTVNGDQGLKITILGEDKTSPMLIYNIPILLRIPQGLLDFAINAQNISAAIDAVGMNFDKNGLTVINGGFYIVKDLDGEELLSFNNGQLKIKGEGEFSGTITASKGKIANFSIETNSLSTEGLIIQSAYEDQQGNKVPSKIQVQNIIIGKGAQIEEYLQLGKGFIRNPNHTNNSSKIFIETYGESGNTTFSLTDDGLMKLGSTENNKIILNMNDVKLMNFLSKFVNQEKFIQLKFGHIGHIPIAMEKQQMGGIAKALTRFANTAIGLLRKYKKPKLLEEVHEILNKKNGCFKW